MNVKWVGTVITIVFAMFMANGTVGAIVYLWMIQTVRQVAPKKFEELRDPPVMGRIFWINPFRFRSFLRANDAFGSEKLAALMTAYRRMVWLSYVLFAILVGVIVVPILWTRATQ